MQPGTRPTQEQIAIRLARMEVRSLERRINEAMETETPQWELDWLLDRASAFRMRAEYIEKFGLANTVPL